MIRFVGALLASCLLLNSTKADDPGSAADLFPATTVLYAELPDPPRLLSTVFDHPLRQQIEALPPWQQAIQSQGYRNFLTGRKFAEVQLGMEWRAGLEALTAGGIFVGFDPATQGVAVLVRGRDAEVMELLRSRLLELTRLGNPGRNVREGEYRGITAYEANKAKFAVVAEWLLVTNSSELGMQVLDRILDGAGGSLSEDPTFQQASQARNSDLTGWAFANVGAVRDAGAAKKLFTGQAENPGVELLVGGVLSSLKQTPFVTAELTADESRLALTLQMPHSHDWVPEERQYYFGPNGDGRGPALPQVSETLFTLSTYRDISEMWLRAGDLFDENIIDGFAEADANLTTLFAGKDFGEDILGSLTPQIGFVATREDFSQVLPQPAIRLPAFALVLELRDPETMTRELRRTYQSMVGFFNVLGAMEGRPQLEMNMQPLDNGGELITSTYIPEADEAESRQAEILFNFSPSVGFAGERFVVSSSANLAQQLTSAPAPPPVTQSSNTAARLNTDVLRDILNDNREQLIAQNMLEEGHSREEAEAMIALLLEVTGYFQAAALTLDTSDNQLQLTFELQLDESR